MIIDPFINLFIPNVVRINLNIFNHSIINFVDRVFCLGFPNTSCDDSLDIFRIVVFEKVHNVIHKNNLTLLKKIKRYLIIAMNSFITWE